jgi:hypothetical protein
MDIPQLQSPCLVRAEHRVVQSDQPPSMPEGSEGQTALAIWLVMLPLALLTEQLGRSSSWNGQCTLT